MAKKKAKRNYKKEYKKFQSSNKAKKKRAELNKYNRKKGTYGNGDGKDASHKGGKIVGFEAQSKNRGRAEKSRLKKESTILEGAKLDKIALGLIQDLNKNFPRGKYDVKFNSNDFNKVVKYLRKKMPSVSKRSVVKIASTYHGYRKKNIAPVVDVDSKQAMAKTFKELGMKDESIHESGIMYKAGVKKYGKEGMKKIQQAAGKDLGHEEIGKIKDKYEKDKKESVDEGSIYYIVDIPKEDMKKYKRDFMGHFNKLKVLGVSGRNKIVFRDKSEFKKAEPLFKKLNVRYKVREGVNESAVGEHHQAITKFILTALSKAGIKILKVQMMKKSWLQGKDWYGGFFTVRSSNMVDMPGHGKVKRGSAVLPFYVDKKGNVNLQVSPKDYIIGKYPNMSKLVQNLKDFKKTDLDESVNESAWTPAQEKAVKELDKKFNKVIGKKGIEPYSVEASRMWTSGGFRDEMKKIFGKNESINEQEVSIKDAFKDLVKDHGSKKALDILTSVLTGGIGFEDPKKKKQFQQKLLKKMMKESKSVNETPYELGGVKVYSKADGLKKVKSMQKTAGAKIYKVTKTKTKLYDTHPVTMYNLYTRNKNHSTNSNPYGLDMMKGVYLIPIKESVNEKKGDFLDSLFPKSKVAKAIKIAHDMGGDMTGAVKKIEKYFKGMSLHTKVQDALRQANESINEEKYVVYVDKDGKGRKGRKIVKSDLTYNSAKRLSNKLAKTDDYQEVGFDDHKSWNQNNIEKLNERMDKRQAAETLKQLGGNKFIMMTGAKNFGFGSNGLSFKIGKNAKAVNYVVIDLNGKDLYDMKFQKGTRVLKKVNDVYNDQLQKIFTKYTGMYTSL